MARRKSYNYIGKIIKTGQPLMLVDEKGENFLYFDKLKMLLPIRQSMEKYDVKDFIQYLSGALVTELNGISLNLTWTIWAALARAYVTIQRLFN